MTQIDVNKVMDLNTPLDEEMMKLIDKPVNLDVTYDRKSSATITPPLSARDVQAIIDAQQSEKRDAKKKKLAGARRRLKNRKQKNIFTL